MSVAISQNGKYIVAGSHDNKVFLFDKSKPTPIWSYETDDWVYSVSISADGQYIAAGSRDNKIYFFNN